MIQAWLFTFMQPFMRQHPDPFDAALAQRAIRWHLDTLFPQVEDVGFDGIFFSEHHFHGNLSASPHLYIAAAAMRTKRVRLGVMGSVLPLHHPWRVAEEIGILDHLSGGRLEIGYSSGTGPLEPLVVGIPEDELRPRFDESLDIIDRAIAELKVTHHGRFWNFDALSVTPRTLQPTPPKWMTVVSEKSTRIAARRGYKVCTAFMSAKDAGRMFDAYREEAAKISGSTAPDQMALRRRCLVWDTDASAEAFGKDVLRIGLERTGRLLKSMTERGITPLTGVAHIDKQILSMKHTDTAIDAPASKFAAEPDEWVVGSPETVAAKIIDQCRTAGAGHFLAYSLGSMEEREMKHSIELWRRVIPVLHEADIAVPS